MGRVFWAQHIKIMKLYGYSIANQNEEAAWFSTLDAAEKFATACGWEGAEIESADLHEVDADDIIDINEEFEQFFISGENANGHQLCWNGEKFTNQGQTEYFRTFAAALAERINRSGMENITIHGFPRSDDGDSQSLEICPKP